jgi:putative colanic acid biosynthesis acetyltransferase WcaF
LKIWFLREFGAKVGDGVIIKPDVNIKYPWKLTIGNYTWIGEGVWIDNLDQVTIGNHCCISQGAMLLCGSHDYKKETFDLITKPITLEEGAWVGAQSLVCPGVTLFSHSVLAAGSVATTHLNAFSVYQGNPAIFKRKREIL